VPDLAQSAQKLVDALGRKDTIRLLQMVGNYMPYLASILEEKRGVRAPMSPLILTVHPGAKALLAGIAFGASDPGAVLTPGGSTENL
jgi:hypothetical protein